MTEQSKDGSRGAAASVAVLPRSDVLEFVIPLALPSLNARDKQHWRARVREKRRLMLEITAAIGGPAHFPRPAWRQVRVTVVRHSSGRLDEDNLYGSFKSCGDALKTLGIIVDDKSDLLKLAMSQAKAARGAGSTVVRIERVGDE